MKIQPADCELLVEPLGVCAVVRLKKSPEADGASLHATEVGGGEVKQTTYSA